MRQSATINDELSGLADALIGYLRRELDSPALEFDTRPTPVALGTEAWILGFSLRSAPPDLDGPLVLRIMISGVPHQNIVIEHAVQNVVALQGFPAPRAILSSPTAEEIGKPFMVMTKLPGEIRPDLPDALELQVQALSQLHALDPRPFRYALEALGVPVSRRTASSRLDEARTQVERWGLGRFRPAIEWLKREAPAVDAGYVICHGDPHLHNMLFADGRVSGILDWGSARLNVPEMDIGLLCGYARCHMDADADVGDVAQRQVDRIIAAYERNDSIDHQRVLYFETEFLLSVLVDMTDRYIRRRRGESVPGNPLLDEPGMAEIVRARVEAVTGLRVPIPQEAAV